MILHGGQWLAAGASGVGMGSKLAGGDIKVPGMFCLLCMFLPSLHSHRLIFSVSDANKLAEEQSKWALSGKQTAQNLLDQLVTVPVAKL